LRLFDPPLFMVFWQTSIEVVLIVSNIPGLNWRSRSRTNIGFRRAAFVRAYENLSTLTTHESGNCGTPAAFISVGGRMKRLTLVVAFAAFSMVGCAAGVGYYYAPTPPPPVRVEAYGPAPGPGFAWVSGYWGWRGNAYAWTPGYWGRPPRPHAVWAPGYWERYGGRYRFHEGRWR
jgi:hypothetical protein